TRTGAPTTRVASASNCGRNWFQSTKYGPTSAAISARMKAIANPSSVVCTATPHEQVPAHVEPAVPANHVSMATAPTFHGRTPNTFAALRNLTPDQRHI